jgi:amino acid transporter
MSRELSTSLVVMQILTRHSYSTGGPTAAFANWTMVGGLSFIVSLSMAEIAAALPTAGGIYYWSFRLGGPKWGYCIPIEENERQEY